MSDKIKSSDPINKTDHRRKALLALALDPKKLTGKRPDLEEIERWRLKQLPKKRANEVKAYVAQDSDCYQMWSDLLDSEATIKDYFDHQPQSHWFQRFLERLTKEPAFWVGGGFAAVTVSLFIGFVAVRTLLIPNIIAGIDNDYASFSGKPTIHSWVNSIGTEKSLDFGAPPAYDIRKKAVLVGVRQGLTVLNEDGKLGDNSFWSSLIQSYPLSSPSCKLSQNQQNCELQNLYLVDLGRWLTLLQLTCSEEHPANSSFSHLQQRLDYFIKQANQYPDLAPLLEQLQTWQISGNENRICTQVTTLLVSIEQ